MANKTITISVDEVLLEKIEAVAKVNFRKRGPEINAAIAYYLTAIEGSGMPIMAQDMTQSIPKTTVETQEIKKPVVKTNGEL